MRATLHRRVQQSDFAGTPQARGELYIFHKRQRRESAHFQKMLPPNENALIAIKRSKRARMPPFKSFQPTKVRMSLIELPIECPSDCVSGIDLGQGGDMLGGKACVGMMEE